MYKYRKVRDPLDYDRVMRCDIIKDGEVIAHVCKSKNADAVENARQLVAMANAGARLHQGKE